MTRPVVAWYVHHHGQGHLGRLLAVRPHVDADVVCFSSLPRPAALPADTAWVELPRDDTDGGAAESGLPADADPTAHGLLHWAPLGHDGHRGRFARIAAEVARLRPAAFVVDVSTEVALFARLLGVPVVLMTQPGDRVDRPHGLAFQAAERIVAPWPGELLAPAHLAGLDVVYVGGVSRHEGRVAAPSERSGVLVLSGRGGTDVTRASVRAARDATPGEHWSMIGVADLDTDDDLVWTDDVFGAVSSAEIVVAWAGQNSVADLAVAGARAVVVPQARPFDEQLATAEALDRAGLAVVERAWPEPDRWREVLVAARALTPDWSRWLTSGASARAGAAIDDVVRRWSR
ncbi:glycosyltransferase [Frigoribacterium sp. 2-23]|uniref:glycosyltransferase n=1 Tax=Frigoribacterium sp. 2-23 TaxID=3415006 RepID=UPI003C6F7EA5